VATGRRAKRDLTAENKGGPEKGKASRGKKGQERRGLGTTALNRNDRREKKPII